MNQHPSVNCEPLPGYRLIERLGSGGYGEVWRAEAPGGLAKAIKFVFGKHDERRASVERRALDHVRGVRHPFLLSLERIEVVDGRLLVVTELADSSVKDRFDTCRRKGLDGIPRNELLGYLRDVADALDFMGETHNLQHLDIKPENLLLLAGHVKVADFGFVRNMRQLRTSLVSGLTPMYAAPEVFRGTPSRHSDQYSLAIVYQEMLTGAFPFVESNSAELTLQHLNDEPDLSALSTGDRYVVSCALAKDPERRYKTCREFVETLAKAANSEFCDKIRSGTLNATSQRLVETPYPDVRTPAASLSIQGPMAVREHAEVANIDCGMLLRHLGSTDGTFLNGVRRQQPCCMRHGDLLQVGQVLFRVVQHCVESGQLTNHEDSCDRAQALIQFDQLMNQRAVSPHFQPIISMGDRRVLGHEALARSRFFGVKDPHSMFAAAKALDLEAELSRVLRDEGIRSGHVLPPDHILFVNTHPAEFEDLELLILSLSELRNQEPNRQIVLEIHEAAVTHGAEMRTLRSALTEMKIGLAYDDFGAGRARLAELVNVPPDYLKFDMSLVQNLESASVDRQRMLASLVQMVRELGIAPLAEGVELAGDHEICRQIGFQFGQGFYYGYPVLPKKALASEPASTSEPAFGDRAAK